MFRSLKKQTVEQVEISINGSHYKVDANSSVWSAIALSKDTTTRLSSISEKPRSAYCAMGVCFECLVEINDTPNRQACLSKVQAGMKIVRQTITQTSNALGDVIGKSSSTLPSCADNLND